MCVCVCVCVFMCGTLLVLVFVTRVEPDRPYNGDFFPLQLFIECFFVVMYLLRMHFSEKMFQYGFPTACDSFVTICKQYRSVTVCVCRLTVFAASSNPTNLSFPSPSLSLSPTALSWGYVTVLPLHVQKMIKAVNIDRRKLTITNTFLRGADIYTVT